MQRYNIKDKHIKVKLLRSRRFTKYPEMFLSNTCTVKVNKDDYLFKDEFIIQCKNKLLPRKIYLYGKKENGPSSDNIYLNHWFPVFLHTIEEGYLVQSNFEKSNSPMELTIGLPIEYRMTAFNYLNWTKKSVIDFLSCLFNLEITEAEYEQQDLLDTLLTAA